MSLKVFSEEKIDVGIIEVGIGGTHDITNVILPKVSAITLIDFDHMTLLGNTLLEIADQKAGIIKENTPIVTISNQNSEVLSLFDNKAKQLNAPFYVANEKTYNLGSMQLGIAGEHQKANAAAAIKVCEIFCNESFLNNDNVLYENICKSLSNTFWPGRSHIIDISLKESKTNSLQLYIDGAHTLKSIGCCCEWFLDCIDNDDILILYFNTSHGRDYNLFLDSIGKFKRNNGNPLFDYCVFSNFSTKKAPPPEFQKPELQNSMKQKWQEISPTSNSLICEYVNKFPFFSYFF